MQIREKHALPAEGKKLRILFSVFRSFCSQLVGMPANIINTLKVKLYSSNLEVTKSKQFQEVCIGK